MSDKELVCSLADHIKSNLRKCHSQSDDLWVKEAIDMTYHIGKQLMTLLYKYKDMAGSPGENGHRLYKLLMPIWNAFKNKHPGDWPTWRGYIHQDMINVTQFEVKSRRTIPMRRDCI
jgi:hypothetical protein